MTATPKLAVHDLLFGWTADEPIIHVQSLHLGAGDTAVVHGPSGCGKSTLLSLLTGVLPLQRGEVWIAQEALHGLKPAAADALRRRHVGYVFQQFNLLPYLSAQDNMLLPWRMRDAQGRRHEQVGERMRRLCDAFALSQSLWAQPAGNLSVGQQQRVAAIRALLLQPALLVADEPTSALDAANSRALMQVLVQQAKDSGSALLVVSHDAALLPLFDQCIDFNAHVRATTKQGVTA
ncbi:ABC transporter ATP-binding protein [Comamonadaceae bacterium M7527]|nr:ABC transporter ATP-binding protein [Comamonadaceae bacterium M7527]